jgi:hypothetical protein
MRRPRTEKRLLARRGNRDPDQPRAGTTSGMGVLRGLGKAIGGLLTGIGGLLADIVQGVGRLVRRLV